MTKMTYREQLLSPFWQRKRLEALSAAGFACEACMDGESTLHVHHRRYVKGRQAWEYELAELMVLCESCHAEEHSNADLRADLLARLHPGGGPLYSAAFMAAGVAAIDTSPGDEVYGLQDHFRDQCPNAFIAASIGMLILEELSLQDARGPYRSAGLNADLEKVFDALHSDRDLLGSVIDLALGRPI